MGGGLTMKVKRLGPIIWKLAFDVGGWWYTTQQGSVVTPWLMLGSKRTRAGWWFVKLFIGPVCLTVAPLSQKPKPVLVQESWKGDK